MEIPHLAILLRLILAHLLADFVFQSDWINQDKKKGVFTWGFGLHLLIIFLVTWLLLLSWSLWKVAALIAILHGLIDAVKIAIPKKYDNVWLYLGDQAMHMLSIVVVWGQIYGIFQGDQLEMISSWLFAIDKLLLINAFLMVTWPMSYLMGYLTQRWRPSIKEPGSLPKAGSYIGMIERVLIILFIFVDQWEAIGFLIAAKSVFRFGDLNKAGEVKKTEYILIGTLLSFTFSIVLGVVTKYLVMMV
jgi:hypothetical protein